MGKKTYTAKDIMTRDVVCVRTGTNLRELEKIFLDKGISGAPVIDDEGNLVGVISMKDLVYYHLTEGDRPFPDSEFYRDAEIDKAFAASGYQIEDYDIGLVVEMMTPVAHTAGPDISVDELARMMTEKGIHRVIITRGKKVVGLVSAMDLLRVIAGTHEEPTGAAKNDRIAAS
jgi:CBS domain-containing protein